MRTLFLSHNSESSLVGVNGTGYLNRQVGPRIPIRILALPFFYISRMTYLLLEHTPQIRSKSHRLRVSIKEEKGASKFGLYGGYRGKNDPAEL